MTKLYSIEVDWDTDKPTLVEFEAKETALQYKCECARAFNHRVNIPKSDVGRSVWLSAEEAVAAYVERAIASVEVARNDLADAERQADEAREFEREFKEAHKKAQAAGRSKTRSPGGR